MKMFESLKRIIAVIMIGVLFSIIMPAVPTYAAAGSLAPVLDAPYIMPDNGTATSPTPTVYVHAVDPQGLDITSCESQYMTSQTPWTGWTLGTYIPDQMGPDAFGNFTDIVGSGTCVSSDLSATPITAPDFTAEMRVTNSDGVSATAQISRNVSNAPAPVVTVENVVTDNNPLPSIVGTLSDSSASVSVEVHSDDYLVDYFYLAGNNANGTWTAWVTDALPVGVYTIDAIADNGLSTGSATGTYTVNPQVIVPGDTTPPTATVSYNPATLTNQDVVATITPSEPIIGATTHTFTQNGSFTFDFTDLAGNPGSAVATVDWIDKTVPTAQVHYSTTNPTNQDVVATLVNPSETLAIGTVTTHTFTANGSYTFNFTDMAGNAGSVTATVNWIDKVAPTAEVDYSTENWTNKDVVATITPSEELAVGSELTHTFTQNGDYTFNFTDKAGNHGSVLASVTWIDKEVPVIKLNGNFTELVLLGGTYTDAGATATDNLDGDLTSAIQTTNNVDSTVAGTYAVTYTVSDSVGNTATATRTVEVGSAVNPGNGTTTPPVVTTDPSGSNTTTVDSSQANGTADSSVSTTTPTDSKADVKGEVSVAKAASDDTKNDSKTDNKTIPAFGIAILVLLLLFGLYLVYQQKPEWFGRKK